MPVLLFQKVYAMNHLNCVDPPPGTNLCLPSKLRSLESSLTPDWSTPAQLSSRTSSTTHFPVHLTSLQSQFHPGVWVLPVGEHDCCLVVFQPYRPWSSTLRIARDWKRHYSTCLEDCEWLHEDRCLFASTLPDSSGLSPHGFVILGKDLKIWFAELAVDMDKIQEISKHVLGLWVAEEELWWEEGDSCNSAKDAQAKKPSLF